PGQLNAGTLASLTSVGLQYVSQVAASSSSTNGTGGVPAYTPTFFPYNAIPALINNAGTITYMGAAAPLTASTSVAMLGAQSIIDLALTNGASYVVFGVGSYTTMSGKTMDDAPVHFDDDPAGSPNLAYARFGVLFQVTDYAGTALPQARFAGTVSFHSLDDGGVVGTDAHIQEYFQNISTGN
ncbi:MAG TPA: hypothetical protein VHV77_09705, partial [Pirellulales bacterium]|nr:hypothetical protein [Pirellulales bacterium]